MSVELPELHIAEIVCKTLAVIPEGIAALLPTAIRTVRRWLFRLGGPGLIPLGVLENSLVVQDNAQQRVVYVEPAIVIDES